MNAARQVRVGGRLVGPGAPCLIAAEVGINHNGDFALALRMIESAAEAGADAVKFQNYRTEDFLSDRSLTYTYRSQGREVTESQWDMFKRCQMPPEWLPKLKQACQDAGVLFFSTPTSAEGVRELAAAGTPLLKNGSDLLTHTPLLEFMGTTGIPVVLSTGMADQQDIDDAVAAVRRGGPGAIILLHCTSAYPTKPEATNLARMVTLRERYDVPVGFSDHTEGWIAAVQAVTLGACFLEKHLTLSHDLPGPDHWFSSTPEELRELVKNVRLAEARMGKAELAPDAAESEARAEFRLSAVAARDIVAGERLAPEMVAFRRPGGGILPRDMPRFVGRQLRKAIARGQVVRAEDFSE